MKQLFGTLKAARWLELTIAAALVCILLVLSMGSGGNDAASDEEARMQRILSRIEGAGRVSVMIAGEGEDCTGAVVVASGKRDVEVMLRLQSVVHALTNLDLDRIEIIMSKE